MSGVYLNYETKLTTTDIPHKVFQYGGYTYFVARHPEGDFAIHEWGRYQEGYGGSNVDFLLDDGTIRTVKGPFSKAGCFDFGIAMKLAELMGVPDIAVIAHRLTVGTNLTLAAFGMSKPSIVYDEPSFSIEPFRNRLRPEWAGLEVQIHNRTGSSFGKVEDFLPKAE